MKSRLHLMYGGTFDPFHEGHLHIACWARDYVGAEVFVTPAADPPHRPATGASAQQRLDMVALGIHDEPRIHADDRELRRTGPSYTVDTLMELRQELGPDQSIGILVGMDSFLSLPSWHRWQEIQDFAHVIVADRPGDQTALPDALAAAVEHRQAQSADELQQVPYGLILRLSQPQMDISATRIRTQVGQGQTDWKQDVSEAVAEYIECHGLYRESATSRQLA